MFGNITNATPPRTTFTETGSAQVDTVSYDPLDQPLGSVFSHLLSNDAVREAFTQFTICSLSYLATKASPVALSITCNLMSSVRTALGTTTEITFDGQEHQVFTPKFRIEKNKLVPTHPFEFNQSIEPWTNTDDVEPDEIEGTIKYKQPPFIEARVIHLKQSVIRTLLGQATLKQLNKAIAKESSQIKPFKELEYDIYKDKEGTVFIGSPDCGDYQSFGKLSSHEELILHRLLTFAIPGTHDGDMGKTSSNKSGEPIILDLEGSDLSIESIAKFIRKFKLIMKNPTNKGFFTKETFSLASKILRELKSQLKENSYTDSVRHMLDGLDTTELDKAKIINALRKDSNSEGNKIDAEASVNLLFEDLKEKSLSNIYLDAQQERLDVLIEMFDSIATMDKWNALQRGIVKLYPIILDKQANYLKKTNIQISEYGKFDPNTLTSGKDSFRTDTEPNYFSGTFNNILKKALPNGQLSPLRALMILLKECDQGSL